ncbi:MAG: molybdopterin molybdotransferase MoeA [Firmicutes bacterium]|nr:molybdopterin molybdotransferase MoeA [Bacillota bacterium]
MKLLKVDTLEAALDKLEAAMRTGGAGEPETELVSVLQALDRIAAEDVLCSEDIPSFDRSTMDGYAVVARDTQGAGETMPTFLDLAGEVEMGKEPEFGLKSGQCAYAPTGGMLPQGADAVAMVEYCQPFGTDKVAVYSPLSPGHNMVHAGDDVRCGECLFQRGRRIRPSDMGLLCAAGKTEIKVYKPWKIYIISTGDEIVPPEAMPLPGQVRDVNSAGLLGEALSQGFDVAGLDVIWDSQDILTEKVRSAMKKCDVVVISGGSSQGKKDATEAVIDSLTSSGAFTHGLAVKPGKPTIIGFDEPTECVVIGLPGHPVAALLLFRLIVAGIWKRLTGSAETEKEIAVDAVMASNIAASPGRKTFQLVTLDYEHIGLETGLPQAVPVLGKSGLIRTMSAADGYIVMDVNDEGLCRGERVRVHLLMR